MKLEQQVCSLELSKMLKELGFPQDSLFYWTEHNSGNKYAEWVLEYKDFVSKIIKHEGIDMPFVSAFTVAELGKMLPETADFHDDDSPYYLNIHKDSSRENIGWLTRYGSSEDMNVHAEFAETEANSRALMLIWLKGK